MDVFDTLRAFGVHTLRLGELPECLGGAASERVWHTSEVKASIWPGLSGREREREIFIDDLLVRILSGESPYGRGSARAEDVQGTPTQSHISPSML